MTTRKDCDKNQISTNITYDQNSISIFLKTCNNQIKLESDKTDILNKINLYFIGKKWAKGQNLKKKHCLFLKRINFKLIRNNMHGMKSLRLIFFLHRERLRPFTFQDLSYDYKKKQTQAKRKKMHKKLCTKKSTHEKICKKKHSQSNVELFTKKLKKFLVALFRMIRGPPIVVWNLSKNIQICVKMQKSRIFYENWLYQEERPYEEKNRY